jgi:hypothetical protein
MGRPHLKEAMANEPVLDTLLLLALPASGKSEVRRYLRELPPSQRAGELHLGDQIQLDDFPYVHFMRVVDEGLDELGQARHFYPDSQSGFIEGRDWGTLLRLVNEDYAWATDASVGQPSDSAEGLLERIDRARAAVGAPQVFSKFAPGLRADLAGGLGEEADRLHGEIFGKRPETLAGSTVVIEFARGGPDGAGFPLPEPHGYGYSLSQLSPALLSRASILYVWVTPEESRRKNFARADPNDPGSILHHSVPISVMMGDYGTCDMAHLIEASDRPNTVSVVAQDDGATYHLPVGRFDNRVDKTSFIREEPEQWAADDVRAIHDAMRAGFDAIWAADPKLR